MHTSLIAEIQASFRRWKVPLETLQAERFALYMELLEQWNRRQNLTAIRDRPTAILRHFVEPAMANALLAGAGPVLLDAGSGAGFPGLPLKILDPERSCLLVESKGKKVAFLREVVDRLGLEGVQVLHGRLEALVSVLSEEGPLVHVLTARAWSQWGSLLGLAAVLMAPGGRAVLFVGEATLRALHRNLGAGAAPQRQNRVDENWRLAARAGWFVRRIQRLPHLQRTSVVALELPGM